MINDLNWRSNKWVTKTGFENHHRKIKIVHQVNNTGLYKTDGTTSKILGVLGYLSENYLKDVATIGHTLTPKFYLGTPRPYERFDKGRLSQFKFI